MSGTRKKVSAQDADVQHEDVRRALAERALTHVRQGSTDQAHSPMYLPTAAYLDERRFASEVQRVFIDGPIAAALSIELPEPNTYHASNLLGKPLLLTRDAEGKAHAFLNTCRHRGAQVCAIGRGTKSSFTCPYHAWTYDNRGALVKVYAEESFGEFNKSARGLRALACEERHGLIFCSLNPNKQFDIDMWLTGFHESLAALQLDRWVLYEQRDLQGPGWKVTFDGYLEVYHHDIVHRSTVGAHTIGNLLVHDTFGPHQRLTFGRKDLKAVEGALPKERNPDDFIRIIHSVFPNLSISGIVGGHCLVSQVFPTDQIDRTITRQSILCAPGERDTAWEEAARTFSQLTLDAVKHEDYVLGESVQESLTSGANQEFIIGRNEPGLQHYHRTLERIMQDGHPAVRNTV